LPDIPNPKLTGDLALFYFESPQPPIVLNAIRNQTSQKFLLELFNMQRRSPRNSGKMGSEFVVQGEIQNRWSEFFETP